MLSSIRVIGTGRDIATDLVAGRHVQRVSAAFSDGPNVDAFGRLRVSEPQTLFDSKLLGSDKAPLLWDESLESGSGITSSTPTPAKPYIDFSSSDSTAGVMTRQTFRRFNYQPGKSQLVQMTGVLDLSSTTTTGVVRSIGVFDDDNGVFFSLIGSVLNVVLRTNDSGTPVDDPIPQSEWNIDNMDGQNGDGNPSGLLLDATKGQIFEIDFQWLSIGRVRLAVEISGARVYVHEYNQSNAKAIPWASTPNLPLRQQITTTADSGVCSMRVVCAAVISEGGQNLLGVPNTGAATSPIDANAVGTVYAIIGIRLKTTHLGCELTPQKVEIISENRVAYEWQLIHNPTVAGDFTFAGKSDSCIEEAIGEASNPSTSTVTGGRILSRGYGELQARADDVVRDSLIKLGAAIDGTRDTLVLAVRPLAVNADVQGSISWTESF